MLPSRGTVRALSSAAATSGPLRARWTKPPNALLSSQLPAPARRLGTLRRVSVLGGGAAPRLLALGAAPSSARAFSLWWSGDKPKPAPAAAAEPPPAAAQTPPAPAVEPVAAPSAPPPPATPLEPAVSPSELDLSSLTDAIAAHDILSMPERSGYLHAIGLDYGWGPTSVMQWALESVHVYAGLGWGASIVATALLLRVALFFPHLRALQFGALMNRMKQDPRSDEAMRLTRESARNGDMETRQRAAALSKLLREEYGASPFGILWTFFQIPFGFGLFRILNGMAHVPVPSLETSGWLWFTDLTARDPYFILPALATGLMIGSVAVNSKYMAASQTKMLKPMLFIFGFGGLFATTFLSAAVNLMAASLGAATLATSAILNVTAVRRAFGLPTTAPLTSPLRPKPIYEAPRPPPAGLRQRLTNDLDDMKKGFAEQLSTYTGKYGGGSAEADAERKRRDLEKRVEKSRRQRQREDFIRKYKGGR